MSKEIEQAAKELYPIPEIKLGEWANNYTRFIPEANQKAFIAGATSPAAREYWEKELGKQSKQSGGWETFCDIGYYGMWAVRPKGDASFESQQLFHVQTEAEATALCGTLNTQPSINETLVAALKRVRETIIKAGDVFTWASELKIIDNALAGEVSVLERTDYKNELLEALREIANINGSQSDLEMLTEAISIASNALSEYGK